MSFAQTLEAALPAQFVANSPWSFPSLEVSLLQGLMMVFGGILACGRLIAYYYAFEF